MTEKNLNKREILRAKFQQTRERTQQIFDLIHDEKVLHESPGFGFRPTLWHLAHIGAFEEYWILNKIAGQNPLNPSFQLIFDPIKTPRESSTNLPSKNEMLSFLEQIRHRAYEVLQSIEFDENNALLANGYVFDLVHQHELQHQETLAYLLHLLPIETKTPTQIFELEKTESAQRTVRIPKSTVNIGANGEAFAYDNEFPAHEVVTAEFEIDKNLTTNNDFLAFVREKGYERREFWSAEGWEFATAENLQSPLYWTKSGEDFLVRTMFAEKSVTEFGDFPVYGVSFYEAEAFAKFSGARLPTEFELETAIAADNLISQLWQWTTSDFAPYPGFAAFPYEDYSAKWFDGSHKVLRGNSFATAPEIARPTFRNFFRKNFRIAFAGVRLARDV